MTVDNVDVKFYQLDAAPISSVSTHIDTPAPTTANGDLGGEIHWAKPGGGEGETVPWGGETFVIRHRSSGRAIAVDGDGAVGLTSWNNLGVTDCCHWQCIDNDGWFGFKHAGRYLGHDARRGFQASAKHHKQHEQFYVRQHPDGGYQLMTLHRWAFRYMGIGDDGQKLVEVTDGGALWDFYKV